MEGRREGGKEGEKGCLDSCKHWEVEGVRERVRKEGGTEGGRVSAGCLLFSRNVNPCTYYYYLLSKSYTEKGGERGGRSY